MTHLADLRGQLQIDKTALDDEVIRQPGLFQEVSEELTEAIAERDAAKEELATVDAELDNKWRGVLAGAVKVTEKLISNHVQISNEHRLAFRSYLDAKTKADKLQALKDSFKQRSDMLRSLVKLYSDNYFESTSYSASKAQDASHYAANRARISEARAARGK